VYTVTVARRRCSDLAEGRRAGRLSRGAGVWYQGPHWLGRRCAMLTKPRVRFVSPVSRTAMSASFTLYELTGMRWSVSHAVLGQRAVDLQFQIARQRLWARKSRLSSLPHPSYSQWTRPYPLSKRRSRPSLSSRCHGSTDYSPFGSYWRSATGTISKELSTKELHRWLLASSSVNSCPPRPPF
jgi:hypothetical protein